MRLPRIARFLDPNRLARRRGEISAAVCAATAAFGLVCADTVDQVDLQRYTGTWYQVSGFPEPFLRDAYGVRATYGINEDGSVSVLNESSTGSCDGPANDITGTARITDPQTNSKLQVSFDSVPFSDAFPGEYWIVDLDTDGYEWAVVSNAYRTSLFVLSRETTLDPQVEAGILDRLEDGGWDLTRLVDFPQCP